MEIALRDYQQEAVAAFFDGAQHARRQLIALPTGAGKTVIAAVIVASTATLARGRFVRDPSLIIYDEAHHADADGNGLLAASGRV